MVLLDQIADAGSAIVALRRLYYRARVQVVGRHDSAIQDVGLVSR